MSLVGLFVHRLADPMRELTGIGRYAVNLTRELVARGTHEYVLLAPFEDAPLGAAWPDVPVVRLGGSRQALQVRWALGGRPRVDDLVPGLDLVHALLPVAAVRAAVPVVQTVHDLFLLDRPDWRSLRAQVTFRVSVRHAARTAERFVVPSGAVARDLHRHLDVPGDRVTVIHEGVDDRFREARGGVAATVERLGLAPGGYDLTIGNVSPRKNLDILVRALSRVPGEERVPVVMAGNRQESAAELLRTARALGVDGLVHLPGFVPDAELPALVGGARALLHPSLHEGFGLPAAEALAAGTPVVAARSGALPEVVGDGGVLVDPRDLDGWVGALRRLTDDGERTRLAARARERGDRFRWERCAEETEEVYAGCL